jgi:hypothetical protein
MTEEEINKPLLDWLLQDDISTDPVLTDAGTLRFRLAAAFSKWDGSTTWLTAAARSFVFALSSPLPHSVQYERLREKVDCAGQSFLAHDLQLPDTSRQVTTCTGVLEAVHAALLDAGIAVPDLDLD